MKLNNLSASCARYSARIATYILAILTVLSLTIAPVEASVTFMAQAWTFGSNGTTTTQVKTPNGVAVDSSGNVFVADTNNHRVKKLSSAGAYVAQLGGTSSGTGAGQFNLPGAVAVDGSGNVYVADTNNHRIQKLTNALAWSQTIGSSGTGNGQFASPRGIALDSNGNIYVVDSGNSRIQKFNSSGVYVSQFGSAGNGNGQFTSPYGITVDSSGNIYVADTNNHRVQKFDSNGTFVRQYGVTGVASVSSYGYLNYPSDVAIDSNGILYVADYANAVSTNGSIKRIVASTGEFLQPFTGLRNPRGVDVDASGNVYAAVTYDYAIRKYTYTATNYQISNIAGNLEATDITTGVNIELGRGSGMNSATAGVRVKTTGDLTLTDMTTNLTADRDWTGVSGDSDRPSGKSIIVGIIGAAGASATHTLYVPQPYDKASAAVTICPNAADLTSITSSCPNAVKHGAGTFTESIGTLTISRVTDLGGDLVYWKVAGLTVNAGGLADDLITFQGNGAGTVEDPYQITTCEQLQSMRDLWLSHFTLMNSIDCSASSTWNSGAGFLPIGFEAIRPFTGSLVGNSAYTISGINMTMSATTTGFGMFGFADGATLTEVHLTGLHIGRGAFATYSTGGLVGYVKNGTISNCSVAGEIVHTAGNFSWANDMGGLVGLAEGNTHITNSSAAVNITMLDGSEGIGGLVGQARGTTLIEDSSATGNLVMGPDAYQTGGFIGWMTGYSSVERSYSTGVVQVGTGSAYNVDGDSYDNGGFVGGMGGLPNALYYGDTSVTDSYSTGNVIAYGRYNYDIGGFVGTLYDGGTITNSYSTGTVTTNGIYNYAVGGFVGLTRQRFTLHEPTITNAYTTAIITTNYDNDQVGGFVGEHRNGFIELSHATGSLTVGAANQYNYGIGGFVGVHGLARITKSYSTGNITSLGNVTSVGGFVGQFNGASNNTTPIIDQSYSTGNVTGYDDVGGFVGYFNIYTGGQNTISNSYSRGTAHATADYADADVGGFAGYSKAGTTITKSYSTGTATSAMASIYVGGFIGYRIGTVTDSYWDTETSGISTAGGGGTGKTTAEMKSTATFTNWDFGSIWDINGALNNAYPVQQFQVAGLPYSGNGTGTLADPYEITTCAQLQEMKDRKSSYYELINDIDCTGVSFNPIGTSSPAAFTGSLDGNDHTISGLTIDVSTSAAYTGIGLFGFTSGATISDLNLTNMQITLGIAAATTRIHNVGGIAGEMSNGTISNVSVGGIIEADVVSTTDADVNADYVGGIVGVMKGTAHISGSSAAVAINLPMRTERVGGMVGETDKDSEPLIETSHASGNIQVGYRSVVIGGFVGNHVNGIVRTSYSTGNIIAGYSTETGTGYTGEIGGFIGTTGFPSNSWRNPEVRQSYATGNISYEGTIELYDIGGFIGDLSGNGTVVDQCMSLGSVTGFDYVGGFAGNLYAGTSTNTLTNSYARGAVHATANYEGTSAGGLIAYASPGVLTNVYSTGSVTTDIASTDAGGLTGFLTGGGPTVTDSYWDTMTSGKSESTTGVGRTTTQMKTKLNYANWNFDTIWSYDPAYNNGYPSFIYLNANAPEPTIEAPTVVTLTASSIAQTSVTVGGNVTSDGGGEITERGVVYSSTQAIPTTSDSKQAKPGTVGSMGVGLTGLTPNTHYYARAYATNSAGTGYGSVIEFTTASYFSPTLTTGVASAITSSGFTMTGNISSDGGMLITQRGFVYSSSVATPTILNSKLIVAGTTGAMSGNFTSLTASTKYYVRAFATNSVGTAYGSVVEVTTISGTPASLQSVYVTFAKFKYNKYVSPAALRTGDTAYIKNFNTSKLKLLQVFLYDYAKKGNQCYSKSSVATTSMFLRTCSNLPTGKRFAYVFKFQDKATGIVATKYFVVYTTKTWNGASVLGARDIIAEAKATPSVTPSVTVTETQEPTPTSTVMTLQDTVEVTLPATTVVENELVTQRKPSVVFWSLVIGIPLISVSLLMLFRKRV